jgi:hypothetical protein
VEVKELIKIRIRVAGSWSECVVAIDNTGIMKGVGRLLQLKSQALIYHPEH